MVTLGSWTSVLASMVNGEEFWNLQSHIRGSTHVTDGLAAMN